MWNENQIRTMYVYDLLYILLYKCLVDDDGEAGFQCSDVTCCLCTTVLGIGVVVAVIPALLLVVGSVLSTQNG